MRKIKMKTTLIACMLMFVRLRYVRLTEQLQKLRKGLLGMHVTDIGESAVFN